MATGPNDNQTAFAVGAIYPTDEEGRPLVVPIVKATYDIRGGTDLVLAPQQDPVSPEGMFWGTPGQSSLRYEPEIAFVKLGTDVVLVGEAWNRTPGAPSVDVEFQVGPLRKIVRVFGDRRWIRSLGAPIMTRPQPFERVPLLYERAYGSWDRSDPDPEKHSCEPRNPVGLGYRSRGTVPEEGVPVPNLEDPRSPIKSPGDRPHPAAFGFVAPSWQPRLRWAGTYDERWSEARMPLLPSDFDRRFFSSAHPDLVAPRGLEGDEPVLVSGASPTGRLAFRLPGLPPPQCVIARSNRPDASIAMRLDTFVVDAPRAKTFMTWRGSLPLDEGPHDVTDVSVSSRAVAAQPAGRS